MVENIMFWQIVFGMFALLARISITLSAELPLMQQTATAFQVATIAHRLGFGHLEQL